MTMTVENRSTRKKRVPLPFCPPQITNGMVWDRTWDSAVTNQSQSTDPVRLDSAHPSVSIRVILNWPLIQHAFIIHPQTHTDTDI